MKAGGNAIRSNEREELCNEREGLSSESSTLLQTSATVALSLSLSLSVFVLHVSLRRDQCNFPATPDPGLDEEHSKHHKRNSAAASKPASERATSRDLASVNARNRDNGSEVRRHEHGEIPNGHHPRALNFKFVASFRHFVKKT